MFQEISFYSLYYLTDTIHTILFVATISLNLNIAASKNSLLLYKTLHVAFVTKYSFSEYFSAHL